MITALLAAAAMQASAADVNENAVVCLENDGRGEEMWVVLAERYKNGRRRVRDLTIEPGKKTCLRYDGTRSVRISHYYKSDLAEMSESGKKIDPWRPNACDKVLHNTAAFFKLGSDSADTMTCDADPARDDSSIRDLVKSAKPLSG